MKFKYSIEFIRFSPNRRQPPSTAVNRRQLPSTAVNRRQSRPFFEEEKKGQADENSRNFSNIYHIGELVRIFVYFSEFFADFQVDFEVDSGAVESTLSSP